MDETNLTKGDLWRKRIQDFYKSGLSRKEWCQAGTSSSTVNFGLLDQKADAEAI